MVIQAVISIFIIFILSRVIMRYRDGSIGVIGLAGWSIFWVALEALVLHPQASDTVARLLGVGRGVDAVLYIAMLLLFYTVFRIGIKVEFIEREITRIVRQLALREGEKDAHPERSDGVVRSRDPQ